MDNPDAGQRDLIPYDYQGAIDQIERKRLRAAKKRACYVALAIVFQFLSVAIMSVYVPPMISVLVSACIALMAVFFIIAGGAQWTQAEYTITKLNIIQLKSMADELNALHRSGLDQLEPDRDLLQQMTQIAAQPLQRKRGRPELSEQEIAHRRAIVAAAEKMQRDKPGLTQKEVAASLKVSERTLSRWKSDYPPATYPKKS